ncbi:MAG: Calx-beta domain-containing protein [Pseudomonadota bacterium]
MPDIFGDEFSNNLFGTSENDRYFGFGGFDVLFASLGDDTLDGGSDTDVALYDVGLFTSGIFINNTDTAIGTILAHTVDKRGFGTDTLIDVSNFHGTQFGDTIYVGGDGGTYAFDQAGDDYVEASQAADADSHLFLNGSGNDTLVGTVSRDRVDYRDHFSDAAGPVTQGVDVDLAAGIATDGYGDTDSLISIERVDGTQFDDTLRGNDDRNDFNGLEGNDLLDGRGGDRDRAEYDEDPSAVFVDLAAGTATDGWGDTDTLISIEQVRGSEFDDTLLGSDDRDNVEGEGGNDLIQTFGGDDFLEGDDGADTLDGGEGFDILGFFDDPSGVNMDLAVGVATDGWGNTDILIDVEGADGSDFNDTLRGDDGDNFLDGREGDDLLEGRGGDFDNFRGSQGNDTIDGGAGDDRVEYHRDADRGGPAGVNVDLTAGIATDGFGDTDTLIDIEHVRGTAQDDTIVGNDERNQFELGQGSDFVDGRGDPVDSGRDQVRYHREHEDGGFQGINVDLANETATDTFGDKDTLVDIEEVIGSVFDDTIVGDAEDNYIEGNEGDDNLSGGAGRDSFRGSEGNDTIDGGESFAEFNGGDRVSYNEEAERGGTQGVNVDLSTGVAIDGFGNTDTLISIEEIRGTRFDDTIVGTALDEGFEGESGNDYIETGDGDDFVNGGAGDDTIIGGVGGEFIRPGTGTDVIEAGEPGTTGEQGHLSYRDNWDGIPASGITVTFTGELSGTVIDYGGSTDTFSGIEIVEGTNAVDVFTGAEGDQEFRGFRGNDIFDGGADSDEVDFRWGTDDEAISGVFVDLAAGTATDRFGDTDTLISIERIQGSVENDTILGDSNENHLRGEQGDDLLDSFGGRDNWLEGGQGNDTIEARGDSDGVSGGDGNDLITFYGEGGYVRPGLGSDTIVGGNQGFFHIDYEGVGLALVVDVELGTTTYVGSTDVDTFSNIVNVEGGEGNDTLLGNDGERQEFFTSLGDDSIDGRGDGTGGDRDWLIYDFRDDILFNEGDLAVTVNLANGTAVGVVAGNDAFTSIEAVRGSREGDHLTGTDRIDDDDGYREEFQGMAGDDTINGGGGIDRVSYSFEDNRGGTMGLEIDLAGPVNADGYLVVTDTFGDTDYLLGIEQITGSAFADDLAGTDEANALIGLEGADTLNGRGGDDFFWGGQDIDSITGGAGADEFGGFIDFLDGDTITDFSIEDSISIFDIDFNDLAADATIVGNELRLDTDGDGAADATLILENGYTGLVKVTGGPLGGPVATVFSVEDAGRFTAVVDEAGVVANVTITRTGDVLSTATVDVTLSGTGVNPVEAADLGVPFDTPITLTFGPGQEQIIYQIGITDDLLVENAEDLVFTLSAPTSDGAGGAEINGDATFVRILDNDVAPSVRIDGEKRNEDAGEIEFTVSRTGDTTDAITVPFEITSAGGLQGAEADDLVGGLPQSGSAVIEAGASSATFIVEVAPDTEAELHDDIIATISAGDDWPAGLTVGIAQATGSIRNDDGVPPVIPSGATGSNFGDPHIVTLDGLAYDFQAVGEFTLIEAVSGDALEVQVRFQPVDSSEVASQTTAVATMLGGSRVVVDANGSSLVSVDGAGFDLSGAVGGASVGDGELYYDGEAISLVYANGEQLRIDVFDGFLSTSVSIGAGRDVRGLLGNADGDASNDLALRDGTVLAQPVSFADLYGAFADDWRISDATSMFDYAAGQGTADFTDTSFPAAGVTLDDFPVEVVAAAEAVAAGIEDPALRDAAILDYLVSGNTDYIEAATVVDEGLIEAVLATEPMDAPTISAGIGISVSEAEIVEGDGGSQAVSFTVYRTGDLTDEVSVDYVLGGDAGADDYAGVSAGSLSFGAGIVSQVVTVDVTGDDVVEGNETLSMSFTVTSAAMPVVISSTASVTIVNDDLATVEPELNPVLGTDRSDLLRGTNGDDLIIGQGGAFDKLFGLGGADVFAFGAETTNGVRDRDAIYDYEVGIDSILLTDGASVRSIRDTGAGAVIFLAGDGDAIYLRGADITDENITLVYDDMAIA